MALPESEVINKYLQDIDFQSEIDALFRESEPIIDRFCVENGLMIDKWYHDLPLWIARWQKGDQSQRLLYLGPGSIDENPSLGLAAYAYRDLAGGRYGLSQGEQAGSITKEMVHGDRENIRSVFRSAYIRANSFSMENFVLVKPESQPQGI